MLQASKLLLLPRVLQSLLLYLENEAAGRHAVRCDHLATFYLLTYWSNSIPDTATSLSYENEANSCFHVSTEPLASQSLSQCSVFHAINGFLTEMALCVSGIAGRYGGVIRYSCKKNCHYFQRDGSLLSSRRIMPIARGHNLLTIYPFLLPKKLKLSKP